MSNDVPKSTPIHDEPYTPLPDDARFAPDDVEQLPNAPPLAQDGLPGLERPQPTDEGWGWHDARLIGVERDLDEAVRYEIGCIDLYTNVHTGDLGGSYLPIASFDDVDVAAAFYHDLQQQIHERELPPYAVPGFSEAMAAQINQEVDGWSSAGAAEYEAYQQLREPDDGGIEGRDEPPDHAVDPLLRTAVELGGVVSALEAKASTADIEAQSALQALSAIGIEAEGFHPTHDPPPFYDAETGTAYWIGIFQPHREDREHCVASILSLGRNAETGEMEAQLAPCVLGDWDKAYSAADYLLQVTQKGGIERGFDAAEAMALAAGQRALWVTPLGMPLQQEAAQELADSTRDKLEVEL